MRALIRGYARGCCHRRGAPGSTVVKARSMQRQYLDESAVADIRTEAAFLFAVVKLRSSAV